MEQLVEQIWWFSNKFSSVTCLLCACFSALTQLLLWHFWRIAAQRGGGGIATAPSSVAAMPPPHCTVPVLLCFSHISQFSLGKFQKMGIGSNSQLVPHVLKFLHINPKWFNAFESWKSLGTNCELATESNLWFFTILTLKKGAKQVKARGS